MVATKKEVTVEVSRAYDCCITRLFQAGTKYCWGQNLFHSTRFRAPPSGGQDLKRSHPESLFYV